MAGRFTIKRFLGEGGMATVFVAEQPGEPREVALKIMNEDLNADRTFVKRFQREAKAASRVQHPNSVAIIDYGVADGVSYIAMELLDGDDLYALLEREGAITQGRAARILGEVCDALMVAHELGIVHRDLKPENIMLVSDPSHPNGERVKVLDFGIAKLLAPDTSAPIDPRADPNSAVTRAGTFIGTPAYMSPEQCALLPVDTRADIYTCGVLLFQLVTGRLPFEGQTPLHTATLHIHEPAPRPSQIAPQIDPRLEAIILKALAKKPTERHQTARHLASALRKILPDIPDIRVGAGRPGAPSKRPSKVAAGRGNTSVSASAPPPADAPMESAKTVVAPMNQVNLPPAVVRSGGEPPSSRAPSSRHITAEGPASDTGDEARTLVRSMDEAQAMEAAAAAGAPRFGPQKTQVIEPLSAGAKPASPAAPSAAGRQMKPTLKSAGEFGADPVAARSSGIPAIAPGAGAAKGPARPAGAGPTVPGVRPSSPGAPAAGAPRPAAGGAPGAPAPATSGRTTGQPLGIPKLAGSPNPTVVSASTKGKTPPAAVPREEPPPPSPLPPKAGPMPSEVEIPIDLGPPPRVEDEPSDLDSTAVAMPLPIEPTKPARVERPERVSAPEWPPMEAEAPPAQSAVIGNPDAGVSPVGKTVPLLGHVVPVSPNAPNALAAAKAAASAAQAAAAAAQAEAAASPPGPASPPWSGGAPAQEATGGQRAAATTALSGSLPPAKPTALMPPGYEPAGPGRASNVPPPPAAAPIAAPPQTPPVYAPAAPAPLAAPPPAAATTPIGRMSGARGLLIGFLAGALIMAVFALVYALFLRR